MGKVGRTKDFSPPAPRFIKKRRGKLSGEMEGERMGQEQHKMIKL
jgi:hypothetical protein